MAARIIMTERIMVVDDPSWKSDMLAIWASMNDRGQGVKGAVESDKRIS